MNAIDTESMFAQLACRKMLNWQKGTKLEQHSCQIVKISNKVTKQLAKCLSAPQSHQKNTLKAV